MLYDHSGLPYEVALAECAERTRHSFDKLLKRGQAQLPAAIETLQVVPDDVIVKGGLLQTSIDERDVASLRVKYLDEIHHDWNLHDNAWTQICAKTGFPLSYAEKIRTSNWGRDLIALNLNTIFTNALADKRFLVRSVKGEARGFLSDRYRRLDMRPIMDNVFNRAVEAKAVVIGATATDTKAEVKFALPVILEPIKNEPMMYWVSVRASDFGESKIEISIGVNRCWCTNDARVDSIYGQVHLGKQLPDDIEFSIDTYRKDTEFVVAATGDVFKDAFTDKRINYLCERVRAADEKDAPKDINAALKRAGLTKAESEAAAMLYAQPDLEVLPKSDSMWRFSNVISFLAQSAPPDRKLELEAIAGDVIPKPKQLVQASVVNVA